MQTKRNYIFGVDRLLFALPGQIRAQRNGQTCMVKKMTNKDISHFPSKGMKHGADVIACTVCVTNTSCAVDSVGVSSEISTGTHLISRDVLDILESSPPLSQRKCANLNSIRQNWLEYRIISYRNRKMNFN